MPSRKEVSAALLGAIERRSGARGQKMTRRIYGPKGYVKGAKESAMVKSVRRSLVLPHKRAGRPRVLSGRTGKLAPVRRIVRALDKNTLVTHASGQKYSPDLPLAAGRSVTCSVSGRPRLTKAGGFTCRPKKVVQRPKRAKRAAPKGGYSAAQKRSQESVKYVTQQNKSRALELSPTQVMRIAGAVTQRRKAGMTKEAALAEVLRGGMTRPRGPVVAAAANRRRLAAAAPKAGRPKRGRAPAVQSSYGLRRRR